MHRECRERFPRHRLQRKPVVRDPGMHHGTCATHVPWCMSESLNRGGGEKRSRHSRRMRNPQYYVSGKRPMGNSWSAVVVRYKSIPILLWHHFSTNSQLNPNTRRRWCWSLHVCLGRLNDILTLSQIPISYSNKDSLTSGGKLEFLMSHPLNFKARVAPKYPKYLIYITVSKHPSKYVNDTLAEHHRNQAN